MGVAGGFTLRVFESLRDIWGSPRHRTNVTPNLTTTFTPMRDTDGMCTGNTFAREGIE